MSKHRNGRALIKGGTIVTMDPKIPNLSTGDVLVDGGRIAAVGMDLTPALRIDLDTAFGSDLFGEMLCGLSHKQAMSKIRPTGA
jgi:hypothetical protein